VHSGHGRTCCWHDQVANDLLQKSSNRGRQSRSYDLAKKERGGHFRNPLALSCSVGAVRGYGQGLPTPTEFLLT
jgi:hypothetical protein